MFPGSFPVVALLVLLSICSARYAHAEQQCAMDGSASATLDYLHSFDDFKLTYFDGRGLAEIPRTLFATVGRYPGAGFEDIRLTNDEFQEKKTEGDLAKNLNRVPVLNHNGIVIGQSPAINRYLAKNFDLFGNNAVDEAQIDAMLEHIVDMKAAYRKLVPYKNNFTEDEAQKANDEWFDTPGDVPLDGRKERQLQWFLSRVEQLIDDDGFSVGERPSLADATFYNVLGEHASELGAKGEPFGDLQSTTKALSNYPKLNHVVETFKNSPGMKHYLKTRGEMKF